ncbi:inorganic phosphate transporter [Paracoccus sp. DMF-8]|uniref:inorganic phosphate transporter n=1 Tax=Paracoccus sp. DMF-8 TaxID=3019445 RepID=UPI0023E3B1A5|nr:inorganic phosphate transporter [Paracoccus sp. DMF-8]MDF3607212.1 inorganic phosphate transporter [Paracoccus sp. DMF-8]
MVRPLREFRILDKDLERLTNAETASARFFRPQLRLAIAIVLIALGGLLAFGALGGETDAGMLAAGLAVATYMALSMGGNDAANSLGPAVGAGAIGLTAGLVLVAIMQISGVVLAGAEVTDRLARDLVTVDLSLTPGQSVRMMVAALLAASIWVSLATWAEAPVSTTHAVVGAIVGAGIATLGWQTINWPVIALIAAGWLLSPMVAGVLAALLLAMLRRQIIDTPDPLASARRWLPPLIALTVSLFVFHIQVYVIGFGALQSGVVALVLAALAWGLSLRRIDLMVARESDAKSAIKSVLNLPLVISALLMGFAHGSNDASNVTAPLTVILDGTRATGGMVQGLAPLLAGLGIAAGTLLFGRKLVHMVGSKITRLNNNRAFCVTLATAITVITASAVGMPLSTTHVAIGGVFGVGFYREWRDRRLARPRAQMPTEERRRRHLVRRSHVRTVFGAWLVTVPVAAALAALATVLIG